MNTNVVITPFQNSDKDKVTIGGLSLNIFNRKMDRKHQLQKSKSWKTKPDENNEKATMFIVGVYIDQTKM